MPASTAKASSALTVTMPSDREIVMTHVFDAPRHLVFEAWTKPEHLLQWFGPHSCPLVACEIDFRVGGAWCYTLRGADGRDMVMRGVYQEISRPVRLISTESFDDYPGESLNSMTFAEQDGRTTLTTRVLYPSKESRDAVIRSGMEQGAAETYDRLESHLRSMSGELVITRVFDAPRNLVFDAWIDSRHIGRWYGPRGFTITTHAMDVRPGGVWRFDMHGPDGVDYPNKITYLEIAKPERLVYDHGDVGEPGYFRTTLTFADEGGKTKLTMRMLFPSVAERDRVVKTYNAIEGANQTLDRLAEQLGKMQELITTRVFDAPRELVFKAWTDPQRLKRWWGPKGFTNPVCELDARPGGKILIHMRAPDGVVYLMTGVFHEIVEPERLVFTSWALDNQLDNQGEPLFEILNTVTFAVEGGKTKLTVHASVTKVKGDAAQHLAGMEQGWNMSLDRLAEELER